MGEIPVRNTFIHFDKGMESNPFDERSVGLSRTRSAPPNMLKQSFRTRWPEHEEKHIRRECKPCAYFVKKADSCRLGAQCDFCHLCPEGAVKARKKEKIREIRVLRKQKQHHVTQQWNEMIRCDLSVSTCSSSGSTTPSSSGGETIDSRSVHNVVKH